MDEDLAEIRRYAEALLGKAGSHGMDHTDRVFLLCKKICYEEGADPSIVLPAALLHDIARPLEKIRGIAHEEEGARMAQEFLLERGYDPARTRHVADAIRTHRYSGVEKPEALEAMVLSDADKLDAMGAVGIARTFMRAGEHGTGMDDAVAHFHDKLLRLPDHMYTKTGRNIARGRHRLLVSFLEALEQEQGDQGQ